MSLQRNLGLLAFIAQHAQCQSNYSDELQDPQGWYSAPNYRSTLDVVWLCVLTVFLCCWTAFHPDIPHPKSHWKEQWLDRTSGLIIGILAPEIILDLSFFERLEAKRGTANLDLWCGDKKWTAKHEIYANMGGFAVELRVGEKELRPGDEIGCLSPIAVQRLIRNKAIDPKTFPSAKEIDDKGKADNVVKLLTLVQIIWVVVQSVARKIQDLPITTLEISTLAYIPCAVFSYGFWWEKPYEVNVPTMISVLPDHLTTGSRQAVAEEEALERLTRIRTRRTLTNTSLHANPGTTKGRCNYIPIPYISYVNTRLCSNAIRLSLRPVGFDGSPSAIVFLSIGAIHLAAWNFQFPSPFESWAWRVCSIIIAVVIPFSWFTSMMILRIVTGVWWDGSEDEEVRQEHSTVTMIAQIIQGFAMAVYAIARLYLLGEVFSALRAAPSGVYKTPEWSKFIPHVG